MKIIIQLQYSRVFHDVKNITQSSLPNPPKIKKTDPSQPMDGWTQPMTNSEMYSIQLKHCQI